MTDAGEIPAQLRHLKMEQLVSSSECLDLWKLPRNSNRHMWIWPYPIHQNVGVRERLVLRASTMVSWKNLDIVFYSRRCDSFPKRVFTWSSFILWSKSRVRYHSWHITRWYLITTAKIYPTQSTTKLQFTSNYPPRSTSLSSSFKTPLPMPIRFPFCCHSLSELHTTYPSVSDPSSFINASSPYNFFYTTARWLGGLGV